MREVLFDLFFEMRHDVFISMDLYARNKRRAGRDVRGCVVYQTNRSDGRPPPQLQTRQTGTILGPD
jgi:hypothetical protein